MITNKGRPRQIVGKLLKTKAKVIPGATEEVRVVEMSVREAEGGRCALGTVQGSLIFRLGLQRAHGWHSSLNSTEARNKGSLEPARGVLSAWAQVLPGEGRTSKGLDFQPGAGAGQGFMPWPFTGEWMFILYSYNRILIKLLVKARA